ncbi:MAG: RNA polymerase sigma factor [Chitinophagaceae bacterium]|nr:RNA polymerase sigma factor [Chitinophagaceae bacterium]
MLVQRCLEGDHTAYRQLYERYSRAMFNTSLRIVNSRHDAEDILQEAFADAFQQLSQFEKRSTFGAWLKQIVVYKSINLLKRKKINFLEIDGTADRADEVNAEDTWYTVEMIKELIRELPDGYRTVLSLYLFEGYSHEQVAETLGLAPSTARTQYIRAKQKLLQLLKKKTVNEH